MDDLELS